MTDRISSIQYGLIGCGVIAPLHATPIQQMEGVHLRWACDLLPERMNALADHYAIPHRTTDYRELVADPELQAVSICTDHASHAEIAEAALRAGKHVLCEKALASSREGLERMARARLASPHPVFSGVFQHRFDSGYRIMKQCIDTHVFGELLTINLHMNCLRPSAYYESDAWRGTWDREGGSVLINQAIHFVDILQWVTGGIEAVSGHYANLTHGDVIETEDTVAAALRFKNGALGSLAVTSSSHLHWEPRLFIYGTEGSLELMDGKPVRMTFSDPETQQRVETMFAPADEAPEAAIGKAYYGPGHPSQIHDFIQAIRERRAPFISFESARESVEVVLALYQSSREQRWVSV